MNQTVRATHFRVFSSFSALLWRSGGSGGGVDDKNIYKKKSTRKNRLFLQVPTFLHFPWVLRLL